MWILVQAALAPGDLHLAEQLCRPLATGRAPKAGFVGGQRLDDLMADRLDRIKRGRGVLEDEGDLLAAHRGQLAVG